MSVSPDYDGLVATIKDTLGPLGDLASPAACFAAQAVLTAGYRKPRIVTTEELDTLPIGTVIRGQWRVWERKYEHAGWFGTGVPEGFSPVHMLHFDHIPEWTVLYMPEETQQQAEVRCPKCMAPNGTHWYVHVRHGNGGGHNEPCPRATGEASSDE